MNTGGAERSLVKLIEAADDSRFEHVVVSLVDKGTQGVLLEQLGVPVYAIGLGNKALLAFAFQRLRKLVREINPDLIHGWMYHGGIISLLFASKTPHVLSIRHSLHDLQKDKLTTRLVIRLLARISKGFKAITYNSRESLRQHEMLGYSPNNSLYIPNGFDFNNYYPSCKKRTAFRKKHKIQENMMVFGNLARYHPVKNHLGLLAGFKTLLASKPESLLLLAGLGVNNNSGINQCIKDLGLEDKIVLFGEITQVDGYLNALDVYVSSSTSESFPNVIGEAMACEVPCIATAVGDSAEIIGETGYIVPANDMDALAEAMAKMADLSANQRRTLGKAARKRVLENYQQASITRQYEDLYSALCLQKKS